MLPPVLWLGLDWIGSGDPLHASSTATSATEGSAANAKVPAFEVVRRAADAVILPTLILAAIGVALAVRRRDRPVLSLAALAAGLDRGRGDHGRGRLHRHPALPGRARGGAVRRGRRRARVAARRRARAPRAHRAWGSRSPSLALVPALLRAREDARMLSVARSQADQRDELRRAVDRAGGRAAVLRPGRPAINPWLQTALAWELDVPAVGRAGDLVVVAAPPALGAAGARVPRPGAAGRARARRCRQASHPRS